MGILSRIRSWIAPGKSRRVKGAYDAAQTTDENANHWANTDNYSANAGMDSGTRAILRERSRYEADNNSYYRGAVETRASDLVGTGPRLQLQIPNDPTRSKAKQIERAFARWARAIDYAEKLRLMEKAALRDGEDFAVMITNDRLPESGLTKVTLDLRLYEADQCTDPWDFGFDPLYTDGVRYDDRGNVESYTFLKQHPGGVTPFVTWDTTEIPAEQVIHWYRPGRIGQHRGIPEMQAALPLFAQLRRYTLATLTAAETAAMLAGVMKSTLSPESGEANDESTFDKIPMARGTLLTLPPGWEASQFKPEQPTGTYKDFKNELLNEIGRTINMPFNVIAGNSSGYNYSSGRLDHQGYHRGIEVDRSRLRARVIDPVFLAWVQEAALAGEIPAALPPLSEWVWDWFFDGWAAIDPLKEANARTVAMNGGWSNLAIVCAEDGLDWEEVLTQRAKEIALARSLGMTQADILPTIPDAAPATAEEAFANA